MKRQWRSHSVAEIRAIYTSPLSNREAARAFGVSVGFVACIRMDGSYYEKHTRGLLLDIPAGMRCVPLAARRPCASCDGTGMRDSSEGFVRCPRCSHGRRH